MSTNLDFTAVFSAVGDASHAPGTIYHSEKVLAFEKDKIFLQDWLCLARDEEFLVPGDYKTYRILGEPVLICRQADGGLKAFANLCLHRGVEVASGSGNASEFACPYHGWLYALDGQLTGAAYMRDTRGFNKENCRLKELHLHNWQNWIFVSFARDPKPFKDYIFEFEKRFAYLGMADMKLGISRELPPVKCNWKLMIENFIDFYHIGVLHKNTLGRYMTTVDVPYDLCEDGSIFINEYDAGSHSKSGTAFIEPIPALKDKPPRFSQAGVLGPNISFFVRPDYVLLYTSWPIDAKSMILKQNVLFPEKVIAHPGFADARQQLIEMSTTVVSEDLEMVESLMNATGARSFVPGRMSRLEKGVQHFIKNYLRRIFPAQQLAAE